jgi:TPR repeat protein
MYEGNYRGKTKADARAEFEALASDPYWAAVLGNMLLSGDEEFGSDPERGIALIKWAAEAGSGRAMTYLALCYFEGKGIGRNVKAGAAWLEKAVATGHRSGYAISAVTSLNGMMPSLGPELTAEHAYLGILMGALEFETVQKLGDRAFFRALQQQLKDGGYYDGPIDGLVGPATIKAALMAQGDDMTEL